MTSNSFRQTRNPHVVFASVPRSRRHRRIDSSVPYFRLDNYHGILFSVVLRAAVDVIYFVALVLICGHVVSPLCIACTPQRYCFIVIRARAALRLQMFFFSIVSICCPLNFVSCKYEWKSKKRSV